MPARGANVREAARRPLEQSPRYLAADALDETLRRHADLAHETGKTFRGLIAAASLRFDRRVGVGMLRDPGHEVSVPLRPQRPG